MSDSKRPKKRELKTLDLEDLSSSDLFEALEEREEIVIDAGVNLDELDSRGAKHLSAPASKASKLGEVSQTSDQLRKNKEQNASQERLKILDEKRTFDRKVMNWKGIGVIALIILVGVFFDQGLGRAAFIEPSKDLKYAASAVRWFFNWLRFLGDYYPLLALASLIWIPLKKNSPDMYALSFDGIVAPTEIGSFALRKRVPWASIKMVDFGKSSGAPVMRLMGESGRSLAELRLDIDDPEGLNKAIARFAPAGSPVRKLINN